MYNTIIRISKRIDGILLKGLGLMLMLIFVAGISLLSNQGQETETKDDVMVNNVDYNNCITKPRLPYQPPQSTLTTDVSIGYIDLVTDSDNIGYGKSGIPILTNPEYIDAAMAQKCLSLNADVYVVIYNNVVKVYPKNILIHHQLINDNFGDTPIVIVYSPLSDTLTAFTSENDKFDLSGRVYKGSTLIFDKKTESLWLQLTGKAIVGNRAGEKLNQVVVQYTDFEKSLTAFDNAQYLSFNTGYDVNYKSNPYANFQKSTLPYGTLDTNQYKKNPKQNGIIFVYNGKPQFVEIVEQLSEVENGDFQISYNSNLDSFEPKTLKSDIIPFTKGYYYSFKEIYENIELF